MSGQKCTACKISLPTQQQFKQHYKSPFHSYNLKRKLVHLQPVTLQQFSQKQQQAKKSGAPSSFQARCGCCGRNFNSQQSYQKHIQSQKFRPDPNRLQELKIESTLTCLFCDQISSDLQSNLAHMLSQHGFFIPDIQYVTSLQILLDYLQQKIRLGLTCLYCNNHKTRGFRTFGAVQQHMIDKQHCFMNIEEDEQQFEDFYDWGEDQSATVITSSQDFEEIKSSSSQFVVINRSRQFLPQHTVLPSGEMRLQNGKILGHKSYLRYYRQFYREKPEYIKNTIQGASQSYAVAKISAEWRDNRGIISRYKNEQSQSLKMGMINNQLSRLNNNGRIF